MRACTVLVDAEDTEKIEVVGCALAGAENNDMQKAIATRMR